MQQIILLKHVEALGRPGSLARVRDGFANNYLLPQGLAVRATADNMKRLQSLREKFEHEEKERVARARALAERVTTTSITLTMKASEEGHLYGSVSAAMIVESLRTQGIELDQRAVRLAEPIKSIGRFEVPIFLHEEHQCELKVWVVEEKQVGDDAAVPAAGAASAEST